MKLLVAVVNASFLAFSLSLAYSLTNIQVSLPDDAEWKVDGDRVVVIAQFSIENHGLYGIEDVEVAIEVSDSAGCLLLDRRIELGGIPAGANHDVDVVMEANVSDFVRRGQVDGLLIDDVLSIGITAFAKYAGLITFQATDLREVEWKAALENLSVEVDVARASFSYHDVIRVVIPVVVSHDGWLTPTGIPLEVEVISANNDTIATKAIVDELVPGRNEFPLCFNLSEQMVRFLLLNSTRLTVNAKVLDIVLSRTVDWFSPLANLTIGRLKVRPIDPIFSELEYEISFRNDLSGEFTVEISTTLLDDRGPVIATKATEIAAGEKELCRQSVKLKIPTWRLSSVDVVEIQIVRPMNLTLARIAPR